MFHAVIINDADKFNEEISRCKEIPVVSNITQQRCQIITPGENGGEAVDCGGGEEVEEVY